MEGGWGLSWIKVVQERQKGCSKTQAKKEDFWWCQRWCQRSGGHETMQKLCWARSGMFWPLLGILLSSERCHLRNSLEQRWCPPVRRQWQKSLVFWSPSLWPTMLQGFQNTVQDWDSTFLQYCMDVFGLQTGMESLFLFFKNVYGETPSKPSIQEWKYSWILYRFVRGHWSMLIQCLFGFGEGLWSCD